MSLYSVIRARGASGFLDGGIAAPPDVADHAAFMNTLANEGMVLFAGPLAGTETGRLRALPIMSAAGEDEIRDRLEDDPWVRTDRLVTTSIAPGNVIVGAARLAMSGNPPPAGPGEPA